MKYDLFYGFDEKEKKLLLKKLNAKKLKYNKEGIIATNINNIDTIGIILSGCINIIRYDTNGKRTIINTLHDGNIFGKNFTKTSNSELYAIAKESCEILFIEYEKIISSKNTLLISNMIKIFANKVLELNNRIELLTKNTIREKLLEYFLTLQSKNLSKTFKMEMTYTDLADYLSIDRTSLMRELKKLDEDKIIKKDGKKITILY